MKFMWVTSCSYFNASLDSKL